MKWEKMRAYVYSGGGRQSFEGTCIAAYPERPQSSASGWHNKERRKSTRMKSAPVKQNGANDKKIVELRKEMKIGPAPRRSAGPAGNRVAFSSIPLTFSYSYAYFLSCFISAMRGCVNLTFPDRLNCGDPRPPAHVIFHAPTERAKEELFSLSRRGGDTRLFLADQTEVSDVLSRSSRVVRRSLLVSSSLPIFLARV